MPRSRSPDFGHVVFDRQNERFEDVSGSADSSGRVAHPVSGQAEHRTFPLLFDMARCSSESSWPSCGV